jgi:predicted nuclease of predicted toxin-antitoxin system
VARFYADEDFPYPVVEALRRRGHDVLTCEAAGRANRKIRDDVVLADAARMGRILLTRNRDDLASLHRAGQFHCGLVLCGYDPDPDHLADLIEAMIEGQPEGAPWLVKVFRGMRIDLPRGGLPHDPHL